MAQTSTVVLIPQTAHPGAPGSVQSLNGQKQQAAAYYLANRDLQTISWNFSNTFDGTCSIQASLVTDPGTSDWFTVYELDLSTSKNGFYNLPGNFVWLRASVTSWTEGSVQLVTASY